jgi:hypothetical protein
MNKLNLLILVFLFQLFLNSTLNAQAFGNVALGGGGFVTGIVGHKTSGDIYCRTDVGGAYRWDAVNSKWIPLLDWNSDNETTYQGVESIALDPQNANNLYLLAGTSYFNGGKTAILKSTDKGNTFSEVVVTSQFTAHGNGMGRSNGERLAVDPNNSNVLFCGTRSKGLWKSTNGGSSWTLAWNGVTTTTSGNGICFVVFDSSSVSGGVTQTIYIGVSRTGDNNIYKSTDGGSTFTAIQPDNSFMPHRAALSTDNSTLYVVMADKEGPWNPGSGRVYKLATATGIWTNITPNGNNYPYGGISVDPTNTNRIVVSTINVWSNYQYNKVWGDFVFLSADGGSTWTQKLSSTSTQDKNGIGWMNGGIHWGGSIEFDPLNTAKVRIISGNGLFTCDNINAATTTWKFDVKGIEETVALDAVSIPGGPFAMVIGDYDGAVYSDIYAYPSTIHVPSIGSTTGIAYAANNTSKLVRVGNKMYYSTNQGTNWTQTASMNGSKGKIALSADGNTILHCPEGSSTTYYSTNNGGYWTSTGVTNISNAVPVADFVNTNKFYIYSSNSGQLLVSTNKGLSFSASAASPGQFGSQLIRAVPGYEGHVWVALYGGGLKYTPNNGTSWTKISNVTYCGAVGFGKTATGATYPTIYIWGTVDGVRGLFRSINQGANWTRINDDAHEWGGPGNGNFVMGDMNVYGRVYMSTVGRGVVYAQIQDCNGVWGGTAYLDSCQTCVGGTTGKLPCVKDCQGIWGGSDTLSCSKDCQGIWGGGAFVDSCGTCVGGTTGKQACIKDCNGVWNGTAYKDSCGICVGGNTGKTACTKDCNGVWGGTAYKDNCNNCVGGNTGKDACIKDCNNIWGGTAYLDSCQTCVGGTTGKIACDKDCKGTWGGPAFIDNCANCIDTTKGEKPCITNVDAYKPNTFNFSPNPFSHSLQLQLQKPSEYIVINASGKTVESGFCQNVCNIATNLLPGLYFLTIKNVQGIKTIKIIKL